MGDEPPQYRPYCPTERAVMPKYWFTMHYPKPASLKIPWFVYFKHKDDEAAKQPREGDMVVFYETSKGKRMKFPGDKEFVIQSKGRSAAVRIGDVTGGTESIAPNRVLEFEDSTITQFRAQLRCHKQQCSGRQVRYSKVLRIMHTRDAHIIKGPIKEIDETTYNEFLKGLDPLSPCPECDL